MSEIDRIASAAIHARMEAVERALEDALRHGERGFLEVVNDLPFCEDGVVVWPLRCRLHPAGFQPGDSPNLDAKCSSQYFDLGAVGLA